MHFEVVKDFWERSGRPDKKFLSNLIYDVSGERFVYTKLAGLVSLFNQDKSASEDSAFLIMALNNYSEETNLSIESLRNKLKKTLPEIQQEYFSSWMSNRENNRAIIQNYIVENGIEKHKNNSKAKMSLVDMVEANILWKSGRVQQKQIAELFPVARNSISNALESEGRWLSCRAAADELMEKYFGR